MPGMTSGVGTSNALVAEAAMPVGLPSQVIGPTAASLPGWVQHPVNNAGTMWTYHPIQISAAAVLIRSGSSG